jgi:hypothetical protein
MSSLQVLEMLTSTGQQLTGISGVNFADASISGIAIGTTTVNSATAITDAYYGPNAYSIVTNTATGAWVPFGCLNTEGSETNTINRTQKAAYNASTFSSGTVRTSSDPACMVIDLGQLRVFNQARYYQTFSDGKTTHAALDISTSGNLETRTSANWTNVHGFNYLDNSETSTGIAVNFTTVQARYIRLRLYNNGDYASPSYIELYNFKLFYI